MPEGWTLEAPPGATPEQINALIDQPGTEDDARKRLSASGATEPLIEKMARLARARRAMQEIVAGRRSKQPEQAGPPAPPEALAARAALRSDRPGGMQPSIDPVDVAIGGGLGGATAALRTAGSEALTSGATGAAGAAGLPSWLVSAIGLLAGLAPLPAGRKVPQLAPRRGPTIDVEPPGLFYEPTRTGVFRPGEFVERGAGTPPPLGEPMPRTPIPPAPEQSLADLRGTFEDMPRVLKEYGTKDPATARQLYGSLQRQTSSSRPDFNPYTLKTPEEFRSYQDLRGNVRAFGQENIPSRAKLSKADFAERLERQRNYYSQQAAESFGSRSKVTPTRTAARARSLAAADMKAGDVVLTPQGPGKVVSRVKGAPTGRAINEIVASSGSRAEGRQDVWTNPTYAQAVSSSVKVKLDDGREGTYSAWNLLRRRGEEGPILPIPEVPAEARARIGKLGPRRQAPLVPRMSSKEIEYYRDQEAGVPSYTYTPLDTIQPTGGKVFYHGTKAPIQSLSDVDVYGTSKVENLYGEGLYLTDNPEVAAGYAKTKGGGSDGRVFAARLNDLNLVDLERPLPPDVFDSYAYQMRDYLDDREIAALRNLPGKAVFREMQDSFRGEGLTSGEVQDIYGAINADLSTKGYDGLRHEGGRLRGKNNPHNVVILFEDFGVDRAGNTVGRTLKSKFTTVEQSPEDPNFDWETGEFKK